MDYNCEFCEKPVDPTDRQTYRFIQGWDRDRHGATNAVRLRTPHQRFAHPWCIDQAAKGISIGQGSLL